MPTILHADYKAWAVIKQSVRKYMIVLIFLLDIECDGTRSQSQNGALYFIFLFTLLILQKNLGFVRSGQARC